MEIQAASIMEKGALGLGYDTRKEEFVGHCVRGDVEFVGNPQAFISFDRSLDESSMARELGIEVGVKARYGLFSGSLAMQFANASSASEYSDVTIYKHMITFKNAKLRFPDSIEAGLTAAGRSARGTTQGNMVGENWILTCGDEFVSQITLGAKLLVSVKVEFATREDRNSFGLQFSFKGPPAEVEANIKSAAQRYGKRASVSVQAFQLGGDGRKLAAIFRASSGQPAILTASLEDPKAVLDTLANVVRYALNDFPAQIDPNVPIGSPVGPAELSYITSPWAELGLFPAPALLRAAVREARLLLSGAFEKNAAHQRRLSSLLFGPVRLSPRQMERCKTMQEAVANNLALINEAVIVAYSDFQKAVAKVKEIIPKLQHFLPEDFEIQPESFAQWWDMRNLPHTLRADKQVIEEIANKFIPLFNDFPSIEDQGLALQREIEKVDSDTIFAFNRHWLQSPVFSVFAEAKIPEIILPEEETTLRLARWLPHVRDLAVSTNRKVHSLEGVEGCVDLEQLSVSGPVESLEPLRSLKKLRRLSIMSNKGALHGDLSSLAEKNTLREVSLEDAGIEDGSVLSQLPLKSLGLHANPLRTVSSFAAMPTLEGFWFGFGNTVAPDITSFANHPRLKNIFFSAPEIVMQIEGNSRLLWTRRGESSLFDVVEELADGTRRSFKGLVLGAGSGGVSDEPTVFAVCGEGDESRSFFANLDGRIDAAGGKWGGNGGVTGTWTATKGGV